MSIWMMGILFGLSSSSSSEEESLGLRLKSCFTSDWLLWLLCSMPYLQWRSISRNIEVRVIVGNISMIGRHSAFRVFSVPHLVSSFWMLPHSTKRSATLQVYSVILFLIGTAFPHISILVKMMMMRKENKTLKDILRII